MSTVPYREPYFGAGAEMIIALDLDVIELRELAKILRQARYNTTWAKQLDVIDKVLPVVARAPASSDGDCVRKDWLWKTRNLLIAYRKSCLCDRGDVPRCGPCATAIAQSLDLEEALQRPCFPATPNAVSCHHRVRLREVEDFYTPIDRIWGGQDPQDEFDMVHAELVARVRSSLAAPCSRMPKIVVLCGSTRFREEYAAANRHETLAGKIVLTVGWFGHAGDGAPSPEIKLKLDELHKRKIDLADEVLVIAPDQYVGDSTREEIDYARSRGKPVRYWAAG